MNPEDPRLLQIARTILEGDRPDWDRLEQEASDEEARRMIRSLRTLHEIVTVHRQEHPAAADMSGGAGAPLPKDADATVTAGQPAQQPAKIGNFRILRLIGQGGMGVVYEAEQQNPKRPVALKVIRGGRFVDDTHVRMFRREVQTLARLKHPGIAAIYESGHTDEGQHFFAMELVRGETLADTCKRRNAAGALSPAEVKERLALFCKICDAISYAHQRGVIHRDLKPANILVLRDSPGTGSTAIGNQIPGVSAGSIPDIKILDFGLARITDSDVAVSTVLTDLGSILGTLPYMSPEQVRGNPDEIDVRTDVYSLGVILYEMLTGQLPLQMPRAQLTEAVRIICEERPGALDKSWLGSRRPDPDLSTIVHKALEKEPSRRYQSAAALAEDLQRYLAQQPILARPPNAAYQLRKLVARHRTASAFTVILLVVLAGFAVTMSVQARRIARERDRAGREAAAAKQVSGFLVELFRVSDPSEARGNSVTAREILDRGAERIRTELRDQTLLQARLMDTMAGVYGALALFGQALPLAQDALAIREEELGAAHPDLALSLRTLGSMYLSQGDAVAARPFLARALQIQEKVLPANDVELAWSCYFLAASWSMADHPAEAKALYERAAAIFAVDPDASYPGSVWCLNDQAVMAMKAGHPSEALPLFERALEIKEGRLGQDHVDVGNALTNVGSTLLEMGRYAEARPYLERALAIHDKTLPRDHPLRSLSLENLGDDLYRLGNRDNARPLLEEALAIQERLFGPDHVAVVRPMAVLAALLLDTGQAAAAETLYVRAVKIRSRSAEPNRSEFAIALEGYAHLLRNAGRTADAAAMEAEARSIRAASGEVTR